MKHCSVEKCGGRHAAKGYCQKHYANVRRHGTPEAPQLRGAPLLDMLLSRAPVRPVSGCWEWAGTFRGDYGSMKWQGKTHAAHRLMFLATHGYLTEVTRHSCDNPPCINPAHLEGGGRRENVQDRVDRGRSARLPGRSNPNARYTAEQVAEVVRLTTDGLTGDQIVEKTGINRNAVYRIRRGQR